MLSPPQPTPTPACASGRRSWSTLCSRASPWRESRRSTGPAWTRSSCSMRSAEPSHLFAGEVVRVAAGYADAVVPLKLDPAEALPQLARPAAAQRGLGNARPVAALVTRVPRANARWCVPQRLRDGAAAGREHCVPRAVRALHCAIAFPPPLPIRCVGDNDDRSIRRGGAWHRPRRAGGASCSARHAIRAWRQTKPTRTARGRRLSGASTPRAAIRDRGAVIQASWTIQLAPQPVGWSTRCRLLKVGPSSGAI